MTAPIEPNEKSERLDIVETSGLEPVTHDQGRPTKRPWIGVQFECCDVYQRIYRATDAEAYEGHCPSCGCHVRVRVGAEGMNTRFLRARPI